MHQHCGFRSYKRAPGSFAFVSSWVSLIAFKTSCGSAAVDMAVAFHGTRP